MQLYILNKNAEKSAKILFNKMGAKYSFKMAIEGLQLICSAGLSDVYKKIPQGKELQYWINNNKDWTYDNISELFYLSSKVLNVSDNTIKNFDKIMDDLLKHRSFYLSLTAYAPFRYSKEYQCKIPNKTILPLYECIEQYNLYLDWKVERNK